MAYIVGSGTVWVWHRLLVKEQVDNYGTGCLWHILLVVAQFDFCTSCWLLSNVKPLAARFIAKKTIDSAVEYILST